MKKRFISGILAAALLLALIPAASAAGLEQFRRSGTYAGYPDVAADAWYVPGIRGACELGLMQGYEDGTFRPTEDLTVAQALALACRIHSIYNDNGTEFVQGSPWYQVYVDYAVTNKIMAPGLLEPTAAATREQFAYLMCGAVSLKALKAVNEVDTLPDVREKSTFGGFVFRLYRAGVLTGSDAYGSFYPGSTIRRCDVAAILTRLTDPALRQKLTLKPMDFTELELSGSAVLQIGETARWTAKTLPDHEEIAVTWAAGNPGVATVDAGGRITAHKGGRCDITATAANGVKKTVRLLVEQPMTGLQLAGATEVYAGDTVTWTAKPLPENATETWVYWASGNPGVATVDQQGTITTLRAGETNITATAANGVKATCLLHVKPLTRRVSAFRFAAQKLMELSPNGSGTYSSRFTTAAGNVLKYTFSYDADRRTIYLTCGNASSLAADLTIPEDGLMFGLTASGSNGVCSADLAGQIFAPDYDGENVDYDGTTTAVRGTTDEERREYAGNLWDLAISSANLALYCFESEVLKPGSYSLKDLGFTVF